MKGRGVKRPAGGRTPQGEARPQREARCLPPHVALNALLFPGLVPVTLQASGSLQEQ